MSYVHAFSCIRTFNSIYFDISVFWYFSNCLPLFSLSLPLTLVASWHLSVSLLRPGTLFILGHLLLLLHLTPLPFTSNSVLRRPNRTSLRTSHNVAFIRNAKSFCRTSLTLTYLLSPIAKVGSHYVMPWSRGLP